MQLKDKVALITGASSGIGKAESYSMDITDRQQIKGTIKKIKELAINP